MDEPDKPKSLLELVSSIDEDIQEPSDVVATSNVVPLKKNTLKSLIENSDGEEGLIFAGEDVKKLDALNKKHAFVRTYSGRPMIMGTVYSEVYEDTMYEFITPESFAIQYCNEVMTVPNKRGTSFTELDLGKWWMKHPNRREYSTVIFNPRHLERDKYGVSIMGDCLNLWEGFGVSPHKGSWRRTRKHLWMVVCNKDKIKFKYLIKWIAWAVQNPGTRAEVAVILKGKKGAGKGFIFTQLVKIFGKHGIAISNRKHLTGQFNEHLRRTSFLFADEAYYPGDKEVEGTLKSLITEPYMAVEGKHVNVKLGINCLHIGMATNNDWVVPADSSERRFFINTADDMYAKNGPRERERNVYFRELWGEMDGGGREAMLFDLLNINLHGWHPRDDVPKTAELSKQMYYGLSKHHKTVFNMLDEGIFPGSIHKDKKDLKYEVTTKVLHNYFDEIDPGSGNNHSRARINILSELGCKVKRTPTENIWCFPELHALREKWQSLYGEIEFSDLDEKKWRLRQSEF